MIVVSDTTPVSSLILIDKLDLLHQLFDEVIIPKSVAKELTRVPQMADAIRAAGWVKQVVLQDKSLYQDLRSVLDEGESEAIALAKELNADLLLMDERKGQKISAEFGLQSTGTIGVLIKAKQAGLITGVKPYLRSLKDNTDFWVSEDLITAVLRAQNEL